MHLAPLESVGKKPMDSIEEGGTVGLFLPRFRKVLTFSGNFSKKSEQRQNDPPPPQYTENEFNPPPLNFRGLTPMAKTFFVHAYS